MPRPTSFQANAEHVVVEVNPIHPVASFVARTLAGLLGLQLAGADPGMHIPIGEPASRKFSGELGVHQAFHGVAGFGPQSQASLKRGFNRALPAGQATAAAVSNDSLLALLAGHRRRS